MTVEKVKKTGWRGPENGRNVNGRPKKSEQQDKEKKTNRELRQEELLSLVRKFKPLQTKAIQAAVKVIDNAESNDGSKLRAAALLIETHRALLKDLYDYRYDDDTAEEITQDPPAPVFSLKMIDNDNDDTE